MAVSRHRFDPSTHYEAVSAFLLRNYLPGNRDGNWLLPAWEYAYTHPWFDTSVDDKIGIWEDDGQVIAAVTYELQLGQAFFHVERGYEHLKQEMVAHADRHLGAACGDGRSRLDLFVNDFDTDLERIVNSAGYSLAPARNRPMCTYQIPRPFPPVVPPPGFRLLSLADENDRSQVVRLLHRGFNHSGEPPADAIEGRRRMEEAPGFRHDLNVIVQTHDGQPVAYAGLWCVPQLAYAYVEPVATDPDYRRRGLGRAAVLEGLRRCGELGATVTYLGTDLASYRSMGFRPQFVTRCWTRSGRPA